MKDIVLQEQYLIDIWRNHRYWNNEIEDPNLVPEYLEIEEVAKYVTTEIIMNDIELLLLSLEYLVVRNLHLIAFINSYLEKNRAYSLGI